MARITLSVCDYEYFNETCLERYKLKEVACEHGWIDSRVTIEGDICTIEDYLRAEYMVGMDPEMKAETLESIEA
ncbi:conserved hypothetical protein [Edwardsiella phage PEi26]|uniref:Uncharacterized 8.8 kDa protein in frd-Gp32 intergenic region n=1 Tax=Edwardsiella phage PEi26 TaxID=1608311 RepID=A0A0B6VT52_9CAUD|nr:conserved hypothetical protein [Edwardsiella phage PEi26]